jgi:hypothetical protein
VQKNFLNTRGERFFAADQFFLKAGKAGSGTIWYEGFQQLEKRRGTFSDTEADEQGLAAKTRRNCHKAQKHRTKSPRYGDFRNEWRSPYMNSIAYQFSVLYNSMLEVSRCKSFFGERIP